MLILEVEDFLLAELKTNTRSSSEGKCACTAIIVLPIYRFLKVLIAIQDFYSVHIYLHGLTLNRVKATITNGLAK